MVICQERRKRCLVLLANDSRAERIFPELTQTILDDRHAVALGIPVAGAALHCALKPCAR